MQVKYYEHDAEHNLFGKPNVHANPKWNLAAGKTLHTNASLYHVISPFLSRPGWKFVAMQNEVRGRDNAVICMGFVIYDENETLGTVKVDYKGRNYAIIVNNDRIIAKRERGSGYATQDTTKAILAIRKHFYRKEKSERLDKAHTAVAQLINSESYDKERTKRQAWEHVYAHAKEFVEMNMEMYVRDFPVIAPRLGKAHEADAEMKTVEDIKKLFNKGSSLLVVRDGSEYIVRQGAEVKVYDDDSLPFEVRSKLGMLKLVDKGQMISDVGCKVDAEVFVVITPQQEQQ
jgi:hypothetical protein